MHVAVTIFDDNDAPVINLGIVNPWMCEASLINNQATDDRYIKPWKFVYSNNIGRGGSIFMNMYSDGTTTLYPEML